MSSVKYCPLEDDVIFMSECFGCEFHKENRCTYNDYEDDLCEKTKQQTMYCSDCGQPIKESFYFSENGKMKNVCSFCLFA